MVIFFVYILNVIVEIMKIENNCTECLHFISYANYYYDENEPEDHPFSWDSVVEIYSTGEHAVWRNKESDSLVKYLVMSDKELTKYSGVMTAPCFRRDIIRAIATFWEYGGKWFECLLDECVYLGDGEDPPDFGGEGWTVSRFKN